MSQLLGFLGQAVLAGLKTGPFVRTMAEQAVGDRQRQERECHEEEDVEYEESNEPNLIELERRNHPGEDS